MHTCSDLSELVAVVQKEIRFMNVEGTKHAAEVHAEQHWVLQAHVMYRCKHFHRHGRICIEFRLLATSVVKRMQVTLAAFYGIYSLSALTLNGKFSARWFITFKTCSVTKMFNFKIVNNMNT